MGSCVREHLDRKYMLVRGNRFSLSSRRLEPRRLHEACSLVPLREVETAYGWDFMVQQRLSAIRAFEGNRKIDNFSF